MDNSNFYKNLATYLISQDTHNANMVIMRELAILLVKDRADFIEVLRSSNILMPDNPSDSQLVNAFVDNVPSNRKLLLGASFLIGHKNQTMSFNGQSELSDAGIKASYKAMYDFFDCADYEDSSEDVNGEYYNASGEDFYEIGGVFGTLLEKGKQLVQTYKKGRDVEKGNSSPSDTLSKQQQAKKEMANAIVQKRQADAQAKKVADEKKAKTTKIVLIVGGSVLALALIVGVIYMVKKSKKGAK